MAEDMRKLLKEVFEGRIIRFKNSSTWFLANYMPSGIYSDGPDLISYSLDSEDFSQRYTSSLADSIRQGFVDVLDPLELSAKQAHRLYLAEKESEIEAKIEKKLDKNGIPFSALREHLHLKNEEIKKYNEMLKKDRDSRRIGLNKLSEETLAEVYHLVKKRYNLEQQNIPTNKEGYIREILHIEFGSSLSGRGGLKSLLPE
jgi:hypothetical protein